MATGTVKWFNNHLPSAITEFAAEPNYMSADSWRRIPRSPGRSRRRRTAPARRWRGSAGTVARTGPAAGGRWPTAPRSCRGAPAARCGGSARPTHTLCRSRAGCCPGLPGHMAARAPAPRRHFRCPTSARALPGCASRAPRILPPTGPTPHGCVAHDHRSPSQPSAWSQPAMSSTGYLAPRSLRSSPPKVHAPVAV